MQFGTCDSARSACWCACASKEQHLPIVVHIISQRHRDDRVSVMQGGRMAAQYDSESKGERNLAFKPVGRSHILTKCTADFLSAVQKAQSTETPTFHILALSCAFSSSTAHCDALVCICTACVSTAKEFKLHRLCSRGWALQCALYACRNGRS